MTSTMIHGYLSAVRLLLSEVVILDGSISACEVIKFLFELQRFLSHILHHN